MHPLVRHHVVIDHLEVFEDHELVHMRAVPETVDVGRAPQFRRVVARMNAEQAGHFLPGETFELSIGPLETEQ